MTEVLVAGGIVAITVFTTATFNSTFTQGTQSELNYQSLLQIRSEVTQLLTDDLAFSKTVESATNTTLACVRDKSDCRGQRGELMLFDRKGNPYPFVAGPGQDSSGFSPNKGPCDTFTAAGNNKCPFQYKITWEAICTKPGKCSTPSISLTAQLNYRPTPATKGTISRAFNPTSFSIQYMRQEEGSTLEAACRQFGGVLGPDKTCTMPNKGEFCRSGEYFGGYNDDGSIYCFSIEGISCPPYHVLIGVDGEGNIKCGPGCSSARPGLPPEVPDNNGGDGGS